MKELSIEEKAIAYNKAIERAKKWYNAPNIDKMPTYGNRVIEEIFPELKDSEDERIMKWCISHFKGCINVIKDNDEYKEYLNNKVIPWLEKQGELKNETPIPRFNIGDWVIVHNKDAYQVIGVNTYDYRLRHYLVGEMDYPFKYESDLKPWTIQDANDGDVLAFKNNICGIIICKSPTDYDTRSYCRFVSDNFINKEESGWDSTLLVPATKEQRDLLFQKMKEAGYEWLEETKELKKIEQKTTQVIKPFEAEHGKYYYCIKDYFCGGRKQASKGDVVQALRGLPIMGLKDASEYFMPVNFIKCNFAWSEEDENKTNTIISVYHPSPNIVDWLKSLKQRYTWKPSEEQMDALSVAVKHGQTDDPDTLKKMLEQLKKLREE